MARQRDSSGRFVAAGGGGAGGVTRTGTADNGVVDVDRGYRTFLGLFARAASGPHVRVGVQGQEANEPRAFGMSNLKLAAVHEFGSIDGRIPQRSFIRGTIDRKQAAIERLLQKTATESKTFEAVMRRLGTIGAKTVAFMQQTIDRSIGLKPLTAAGIASKQVPSTTPLLDTGQLKRAITWQVFER